MRRTPLVALTSLVLAAALILSGCSGSRPDPNLKALPEVSGDPGAQPTLSWSGADAPADLTVKTLSEGDGDEVVEGDLIAVSYAGWKWGSDEVFDSSYSRGVPALFPLTESGLIEGWRRGLPGHRVGDRLEMAIPADQAYGDDESQGKPSGPLVFVVEIRYAGTAEDIATGTADAVVEGEQAAADRGVSVTGDLGAEASITVDSEAAEPTEPEVMVLARGTGEPVGDDSVLLANMAFTPWDNSQPASSWASKQPQLVPMALATNLTGLKGLPVGSRVIVLMPAGNDQRGQPVLARASVMDIEAAV